MTEERVSESENRSTGSTQSEEQRVRWLKMKRTGLWAIEQVWETQLEFEEENGSEKMFREIITKHFPNWMKDINVQIPEAQHTGSRGNMRERSQTRVWVSGCSADCDLPVTLRPYLLPHHHTHHSPE